MPVQKVMNIVATTGTYQKDGQEKKEYLTVGALFIYDDGGMSIKLKAVPTNFDGNLSVYERDNQQQQQGGHNQSQQGGQNSYQQPQQQHQAPQQTYNAPHGEVPVHQEQYNPNQR